MESSPDKAHISGNLIKAQVAYAGSPLAHQTARAIIRTKVRASELLLTGYIRSRRRVGYDSADTLRMYQTKLSSLSRQSVGNKNRRELFLLEARAAHIYWQAFKLLCRLPIDWCRVYPHANDVANVALNSGYTILARKCYQAIGRAGLLPAVGLYHGENSRDPLVYDFMECFRVPAVDMVIIPFFARRSKAPIEKDSITFKKIIARLTGRYSKKSLYQKRCETLDRLLLFEAIRLREAILRQMIWIPHQSRFGHHRKCQ